MNAHENTVPSPAVSTARSRWMAGLWVYLRSSVCSMIASVVDLGVVEICVRGFAMSPAVAKVPALILATAVQFWASRHFAFRAGSGPLGRQLHGYLAVQFAGGVLTVGLFHLLVRGLHVPLELANILAGAVVTNAFAYPLLRWVFAAPRTRPAEPAPATI